MIKQYCMATLFYITRFVVAIALTGAYIAIPGFEKPLVKQSSYMFIIRDTALKTTNTMVHSFSLNGQLPPKILQVKPNDPVTISFRNDTPAELMLVLPKAIIPGSSPKAWETILPGQTFSSGLITRKTGVYDYRITRMEQKGNGVKGLIVIKQP
jgi:hypothetical protein